MKTIGPFLTSLAVVGLLAGCGGGSDGAQRHDPPGSPDNPVRAKQQDETSGGSEQAATAKPGYAKLLQRQTSKPARRFTPCDLVTKAQAKAILRTAVEEPVEAPLGPTCIYRAKHGKASVTLAVTAQSFARATGEVKQPAALHVAGHRAVCGTLGQSTLYVSVGRGQTLSVAAPCVTALRFATTAVRRLDL